MQTEAIEIHLPISAIESLNEAVEAGHYHNQSEFVQALLAAWQAQQTSPFANLDELRALCDEGEKSGSAEPFTLEELMAEIRKPRS